MSDLPNSLALTTITDDAEIIASDHRNNYAAIQTGTNGLITALSGGTSGQFLRATDTDTVTYAYPPGYEYDYAALTSNVTVSGTSGAQTAVLSGASVTYDGTAVWVEFYSADVAAGTSDVVVLVLNEDGAALGFLGQVGQVGTFGVPVLTKRKLTPSAGAHTFSVTAYRVTNNGTIQAGSGAASTYMPTYLRVTKA